MSLNIYLILIRFGFGCLFDIFSLLKTKCFIMVATPHHLTTYTQKTVEKYIILVYQEYNR